MPATDQTRDVVNFSVEGVTDGAILWCYGKDGLLASLHFTPTEAKALSRFVADLTQFVPEPWDIPCEHCGRYYALAALRAASDGVLCPGCWDRLHHPEEFK